MVVLSGLGSALQKRVEEIEEEPADRSHILRYTVAIAGFVVAIPIAGMVVATFLFVAAVLHWIESQPLLRASAAGAGLALLSWLLFDFLLGVTLPAGLLGIG